MNKSVSDILYIYNDHCCKKLSVIINDNDNDNENYNDFSLKKILKVTNIEELLYKNFLLCQRHRDTISTNIFLKGKRDSKQIYLSISDFMNMYKNISPYIISNIMIFKDDHTEKIIYDKNVEILYIYRNGKKININLLNNIPINSNIKTICYFGIPNIFSQSNNLPISLKYLIVNSKYKNIYEKIKIPWECQLILL